MYLPSGAYMLGPWDATFTTARGLAGRLAGGAGVAGTSNWRGQPSRRVLLAVVAAAYLASLLALYHGGLSKTLGVEDYISDEVWYIPSSINVARKVLGWDLVARVNSSYAVYTVFYNPGECSPAEASLLIHEHAPGARILGRQYSEIHALLVEAPLGEHQAVASLPQVSTCFLDAVPGVMPDKENINNYLNTEHPPLVKYIFAALIDLLGFRYWVWRAASFAAGALGLAAVAATAYWAARRVGSRWALVLALAPAALALLDQSVQSMSAVGMLDIYAASLDALAVAALLYGHPFAAALLAGLAGSAKYTGLFVLPALLVYARLRGLGPAKTLVLLSVPLAVVLASWIPFIEWMGPGAWLDEVVGSLRWHTTSRPAEGPPSTTPLGLLLGVPGFILHYVDGRPLIVAASNPVITLPALLVSLAGLAAAALSTCIGSCTGKNAEAFAAAALASAVAGYALVYAAGNHTLYNFYSVQLSMLSGIVLAVSPLLAVEAARWLGWAGLRDCLATETALRWTAGAAAAAGALASALLHGMHPWPGFTSPAEAPFLYTVAADTGKLARLALLAAAVVFYWTMGYRFSVIHSWQGRRRLAKTAAAWFGVGLLAYTGPAGVFAPVLAAAARAGPGLVDGLLAGLLAPSPVYAGLAGLQESRIRRALYLLGLAAGFHLATLLAHGAGAGAAAAVAATPAAAALAGAATAVLLEARPAALLALMAAYSPDTMAVLLAAGPRGGGYTPWPFIAVAAAASLLGSPLLLRAAAVAAAIAAAVDTILGGINQTARTQ
ncbi:glycosyltransferase family protein [Pyrodictium delaneyi]|uniref:Glycosyltransferase family protein n=1 Tax=Pyrodictium delaneyi TaxID=1273541 RepID=A0A0P0N2F1_9CREN|nr:hypothetical protein [Pyrodictium delaneyi]ALL00284.1 glycosyltransferase family protein [Pyrodictium delaneyi]OWJ54357.1 hypothetical protein Pdsh_07725 [Pyrodictium delaneyi]